MGEAGSLSTARAPRRSSPRSPRPPTGRVPVIAGVSAGTAEQAGALRRRRGRRRRGRAHVPAAARLPRRRGASSSPSTRAVGAATGLPLMVYNNPEASGVDMPRRADRADRRGASSRSSRSRSARATCAGSPRCCTRRDLEVLVGGDDWALEGFARRRDRLGHRASAYVAPARVRRALRALPRRRARRARARSTAGCCRSARFDMTPKLVQYFKAAMDDVGFAGGPTRAPRLPLTDDERAALREALAVAARAGVARLRAARYLAAVDSHTEGMPTRVITGGVGPIPGATMLERKLHFEAERDDLRLLLMREPRGHAAMSGAILQPPTRDDADWGVLFIEVSGCLPMCGHGTIGVATVLVETGMVEVREPETVVRLDTPAGLVEARVAVAGGRAEAVTIRNVPAFLHARDQVAAVDGPRRRCPTTWPSAATSTRSSTPPRSGLEVDPARAGELIEARRPDPRRDQRRRRRAPGRRAHRRLPSRRLPRAGPRRRATRATRPRSTPAGWTARRAARARARGWRRCTRAASSRWARTFVNESIIGTRFTGRLVEEIDGRRRARRRARGHRARVDHRHGPVPARRARPLPGRLRPVRPCEVAVVGAGIVGAATAWELHARGVDVALLDRGEVSGATTGLGEGNVLCSDKDAGPELDLTIAGLRRLRRARGAARRAGAHPPQGRARRPPRARDVGAARRCASSTCAPPARTATWSTPATCAPWSPSSRATWRAPRSSRATCSARRGRSRAASPPACRACTPAWRCRRSRSRAAR